MPYKKSIQDLVKAGGQAKPMTKGLSGPAWMAARSQGRDLYSGEASNLASRQESYERQLMSQRNAASQEKGDYKRVRSKDGGWNYFGPDGQPVSAAEYAQGSNQTLPWALEGSQNPDDWKILNKFKEIKDFALMAEANKNRANADEPFLYTNEAKTETKPYDARQKLLNLVEEFPHVYGDYLNK